MLTGTGNACVRFCSENHSSTAKSQLMWGKKNNKKKTSKIKWDISKWCLRPGFHPLAAKLPGLWGPSTSGTIKLPQHQPSGDPHSALMSIMDFCGRKKKWNSTFYLPLTASRGRSLARKPPGSAAFRLETGGFAQHCVVQIRKAIFLLQE